MILHTFTCFSTKYVTCFAITVITILFWVLFLKWKQGTRVIYNKDSIIRACNLIEKRLQHRCFSVIDGSLIVFRGPSFLGSMFSRVQVFKGPGPGFTRSPLHLHGNHTSICFLHISEHLFIRTALKDCFCMFKLWFLCFCINSLILRIVWAFMFFH